MGNDMIYLLYLFLAVVGLFVLNILRKTMIGKSMKKDIFNRTANIGDAKWWSAADGRLLLPVLLDESSAAIYLARNEAGTEWSVAKVNDDFKLEDITATYATRLQAIKASAELQEKGHIEVCYITAQYRWMEAVENGSTL